jgi:hypothetical protein
MTHTFAEMEVSHATFREVSDQLQAAGYTHAFVDGAIDMHGIALVPMAAPGPVPLRVLVSADAFWQISDTLRGAKLWRPLIDGALDMSGICLEMARGPLPDAVLNVGGPISPEQRERIRAEVKALYSGTGQKPATMPLWLALLIIFASLMAGLALGAACYGA